MFFQHLSHVYWLLHIQSLVKQSIHESKAPIAHLCIQKSVSLTLTSMLRNLNWLTTDARAAIQTCYNEYCHREPHLRIHDTCTEANHDYKYGFFNCVLYACGLKLSHLYSLLEPRCTCIQELDCVVTWFLLICYCHPNICYKTELALNNNGTTKI